MDHQERIENVDHIADYLIQQIKMYFHCNDFEKALNCAKVLGQLMKELKNQPVR